MTVALFIGRNIQNARILRIVAQLITVATVITMIPLARGVSAWYLLGVPLAAAALPLLGGNALLWVTAAVVILVWELVLGVGIGYYLLPAGACMLAAATAQLRASARDRK